MNCSKYFKLEKRSRKVKPIFSEMFLKQFEMFNKLYINLTITIFLGHSNKM